MVVSEETGKSSTASGGTLSFDLTLEQLEAATRRAAIGRRTAA
jgi:hypothetical protein